MKNLIKFIILISILSCENRKIKYSGINDKFIGADQIVLYENGEFYLELGAGGLEGKYEIKNDTIYLSYNDVNESTYPDKLLITEDYFITIGNDSTKNSIKIRR